MKHKKVNAVLSMDGSQEYGYYMTLFKMEDFDLENTNVPHCLLVNNFENFSIYPYYNSIVSEDKYLSPTLIITALFLFGISLTPVLLKNQ